MATDLSGKTALVTGSSKGIGFAIARDLAAAGANVAVSARNADEVERAAKEVDGLGSGRVIGVPCDVRSHSEVKRLVDRTIEELGGLDILVNNAGVGGFAPIDEIDVERWDTIIETNLSGVFYACREAVPHMRGRGDGWIINIASLAGKNPFAGGAAYNASKFGLVGFSEALMMDVRNDGIRVNYIMPGSVNTHFFDGGPQEENGWMLQPEDISQLVLDLLAFPSRALPSRIEVRPTRPTKK